MKKTTLVGRSANTRIKYQNLAKFYWFHFVFTRNAIRKNKELFPSNYFYADLNSGDGYCQKYGKGSPIIAAETGNKVNINWTPHFIERCSKHAQSLRSNFHRFNLSEYANCVVTDDYSHFLEGSGFELPVNQLGLIFADPNGINDLHEQAIEAFLTKSPRIDVMIHINSTTFKRVMGAFGDNRNLESVLKAIGEAKISASPFYYGYQSWREVWHVREPFWTSSGWWTLLFCCLTDKFKASEYLVELSRTPQGQVELGTLNSLQSPRGKEIFDFLTLPASEFRSRYSKPSYTKQYHRQLSLNLGV